MILKSIKRAGKLLHLGFVKTVTSHGAIHETQEQDIVCAKTIVLAIPSRSIEILDWDPVHNDKQVISDIHSKAGVPAVKVFISFDSPWWRHLNDIRYIVSDFPTRQTMEMKVRPDGTSLLLATYSDNDNVDFWEGLTKSGHVIPGNYPNQYNVTGDVLDQLLTFIAESMDISKSDIPLPSGAGIHIWKADPVGPGLYLNKPGYDWREVQDRMSKPHTDYEVYVVSTFGHDQNSQSGEGAIQGAEYTLAKHFNKAIY